MLQTMGLQRVRHDLVTEQQPLLEGENWSWNGGEARVGEEREARRIKG